MRRLFALALFSLCHIIATTNIEDGESDIKGIKDIFPEQTTFFNFTEFERSGTINIDMDGNSYMCLHYKFCSQCDSWQFCEDEQNLNCTRGKTSGLVDKPREGIFKTSNDFIGYSFTGKSCSFTLRSFYQENCWETDSLYFNFYITIIIILNSFYFKRINYR